MLISSPARAVAFVGALLLAAAPPAFSLGANRTEEEALRKRATDCWTARVSQDWKTLYACQDPALRATTTEEDFVGKRDAGVVRYLSYELGPTEIEEGVGWSEVTYSYAITRDPTGRPTQLHTWEPWKQVDGQWYVMSPTERTNLPNTPPALRKSADARELRSRAEAYWKANTKQQWPKAYQYYDPDYRSAVPESQFVHEVASLFEYPSARVEWAEADGDKGRVKVRYQARITDPSLSRLGVQDHEIVETWVRIDGTWFLQARSPQRKAQKGR
jgi:hypothetical protein